MKTENINIVYFSATYTTRNIIRQVAAQLEGNKTEYDITQTILSEEIGMSSNDLLLIGMPVYAGRIPAPSRLSLQHLKGNDTPAIIVCVYGNRDYDDALLELKETVEGNGFKVISAGAFIAQHSIFPQVGTNRPDEKDKKLITGFAERSQRIIDSAIDLSSLQAINVKGNNPYKIPGKLPLRPKGNRKCTACGSCVKLCPTQAIPADAPRSTDKDKCIACGRCIVICPAKARSFGGLLYKIAGKKFIKTYSARKEPEIYI